jgi:hypothetical protein
VKCPPREPTDEEAELHLQLERAIEAARAAGQGDLASALEDLDVLSAVFDLGAVPSVRRLSAEAQLIRRGLVGLGGKDPR